MKIQPRNRLQAPNRFAHLGRRHRRRRRPRLLPIHDRHRQHFPATSGIPKLRHWRPRMRVYFKNLRQRTRLQNKHFDFRLQQFRKRRVSAANGKP